MCRTHSNTSQTLNGQQPAADLKRSPAKSTAFSKPCALTCSALCTPAPSRSCRAALTEGGKLQVDEVILPDGEEYKSMEVLQKVWWGGGGEAV